MSYKLHEPTPFSPSAPRIHYGRGGAGNFAPASLARNTDKQARSATATSGLYTCGRGGAGNMHTASERAMFSFDEEMARERLREETTAPVFHVGRGGAGNAAHADRGETYEPRTSTSSNGSGASDLSKRLRLGAADRLADRISGSFHRKSTGTYERS